MFRKLIYLFYFVLVLSVAGAATAQEEVDILIRSPDLAMPVIDGVIDDVWSVATEQTIETTVSGSTPGGPSDCSGTFRVLWDWEYIYGVVVVKDEALNNDSGAGAKWNDDSVEFYVDGDNTKGASCDQNDHQYTCRWNNAVVETPSAYHNGEPSLVGYEYAVVTTGNGYIYEVRIPWTSIITEPPTAGDLIGIEVFINDDDDGGDRDSQIAWFGTSGEGWQTPSMWATAQLVAGNRAGAPKPSNGSIHPETWANISWMPGPTAVTHDVYFGDNFEDVNTGAESTFQGNQTATFMVVGFPGFVFPDGLVPGTTYYWRVDAINAEGTIYKGVVWNFSVPPKTAYSPDPADGAESIDVNVQLAWTPGFGAKLHTVYFGDNFDDVNNASGGLPQGVTTYSPGPLDMAKTYYWRVDEFDAVDTYKGEVWSFTTEGAVGSPNPANGAVDVKQTAILSWMPGFYAASHQVYFGTDEEAVRNATTGSPEYKGIKALGSETFDPGILDADSTYYWRIDEVNDANPDSPWKGNIWSFTTASFLVVDDFEDYDAGENQIWYAWKDGLGYGTPGTDPYYAGNGSGSAVGDENTPSYTEETIVHGGSQAMPLFYDNNKQGFFKYSEAELTLTYPRIWTENGVNMLTIWFRGDSANAVETLYVALNGSAVVNNDVPDAVLVTDWTEWNVDLQAFTDQGVNLANINTIALGLGNKKNPLAGGSGTMYFDDIRLYPPAP